MAVLLPLALAAESTTLADMRAALPELLMLGVFSTAVAFAIQIHAQRFVSASTAAILVSAKGLFGAAGALPILGEITPLTGFVGAALILGAIVLVALGVPRPADAHPDKPCVNRDPSAERRVVPASLKSNPARPLRR